MQAPNSGLKMNMITLTAYYCLSTSLTLSTCIPAGVASTSECYPITLTSTTPSLPPSLPPTSAAANGLSVDGGGHGILDSSSSDEERDRKTSVPVVVHDEDEHIPHAIRKKLRKVACRRSHSPQGTSPSPPRSHSPISPRSSPGHSPISPSPRGVRRKIEVMAAFLSAQSPGHVIGHVTGHLCASTHAGQAGSPRQHGTPHGAYER